MTDQHPINPPPELIAKWASEFYGTAIAPGEASVAIATQAARWGSDQELEACCELTRDNDGYDAALALRADRRPGATSLKQPALQALGRFSANAHTTAVEMTADFELLRQAVLQLPD